MLQIKTLLSDVQRFDITVNPLTTGVSGYQGQWLVPSATIAAYPSSGAAGAFQIWTEGMRDGTAGFTPDVQNTSKLTVLYGKYKARTDQYDGTVTVGTELTVNASGKLAPAYSFTASGSIPGASFSQDFIYGVCIGAGSTTWFGNTINYIDYVTV